MCLHFRTLYKHFCHLQILSHSYTDSRVCHARCILKEQFAVQYLDQGHFDMQLGGARIQTSNLSNTRRLAQPPELQLPSDLMFSSSPELFSATPMVANIGLEMESIELLTSCHHNTRVPQSIFKARTKK